VAVSFIGEGNRSTRRKTTDLPPKGFKEEKNVYVLYLSMGMYCKKKTFQKKTYKNYKILNN
jgi:hypothetical protein